MRLVRRTLLKGELKGRVEIVLEDDERTVSFITAVGSDSDVQMRPAARPLTGRRFATHVEEYLTKRRGLRGKRAQICEELHDKTGRSEALWKKQGGLYGCETDARGRIFRGPVFRNDAEVKSYLRILNDGQRKTVHEG